MNQRVPLLLSATALDTGTDLVARVGQFGIYGYGIVRATVNGPSGIINLYRGFISESTKFSTVQSGGIADAQFTPPESIPPGNDVICVWVGGTGYTSVANFNVTTDGGRL